jgi:hypothetical protein
MDNVKPLSNKAYTPRFVIETLMSKSDDIEQIYVMTYNKAKKPTIYLVGDLHGAKIAVFDFERAIKDKAEDMQGRTWED